MGHHFQGGVLSARSCAYPEKGNLVTVNPCQIEIDILKHPIGKQDQYAAAYGGMNFFRFNPDGTVNRKRIFLDDRNARNMRQKLMLFYTGKTRSTDDVLKEQKQNTASKLDTLDYMRGQAEAMYDTLRNEGFTDIFGQMLHEGWLRKQTLASAISNPDIAEYYESAMKAGAKGGKLLGAGGGGFLLFYCDESLQPRVESAIGLRRVDFHVSLNGSRVVFFS